MLRGCSQSVDKRKILKIEVIDIDSDTSTSSCDSSEIRVAQDFGGGGFSGLASAEKNPLQNVVILNHLFELCPADVLATCRLVCKQWHKESLLSWRNSTPLTFTLKNELIFMKYVGYDGERHTLPLQKFLEYTADPKSQSQGKPYRYVRLRDSTIYTIEGTRGNKKTFEIFWNAFGFGGNLTTLELMDCTFPDDEEFRRIIFSRCPKLRRLIIENCKFPSTREDSIENVDPFEQKQPFEPNGHLKVLKIVGFRKNERRLPVSWLELLSHFPSMSSLSVGSGYQMPDAEFDSLSEAIRTIRTKDKQLLAFKVFDVGAICVPADPSTQQRLTVFEELRLPLQTLFVNLKPDVEEDLLKDDFVLTSHRLNNVVHLFVDGHVWRFCKNLAFMKYLPNVKMLNVYDGNMTEGRRAISNITNAEPMMKVTHLELRCFLKDGDVAKLYKLMPNVTDLSIDVNNKQFGIVCDKWRNLKQLCVYGHKLTDDGLTGMRKRRGRGRRPKEPNITNLQNLEEFSFRSTKLTDKSAVQGFLKLPNLRVLWQFGEDSETKWRESTRRAILDKKIRLEGNLRDP